MYVHNPLSALQTAAAVQEALHSHGASPPAVWDWLSSAARLLAPICRATKCVRREGRARVA